MGNYIHLLCEKSFKITCYKGCEEYINEYNLRQSPGLAGASYFIPSLLTLKVQAFGILSLWMRNLWKEQKMY